MRERVHARKSHRHAENDASRGGRAPEAGGKKGPAVKPETGRTACGGATLDPSDPRPHAFVDNGRTGTEPWAGGAGLGARGDQPSGSADEIRPVYEVVRDLTRVVRRSAWVPSGRVTEAEAS